MLFNNRSTPARLGTQVATPRFLGWDVSSINTPPATHPRDGAVRRLRATRSPTSVAGRAAAAHRGAHERARRRGARGQRPASKLLRVRGGRGIAAVGGSSSPSAAIINYTQFTNFTSITFVGLTLLGGLGYLAGPVLGATLAAARSATDPGLAVLRRRKYIGLISGLSIIALVCSTRTACEGEHRSGAGLMAKLGGGSPRPATRTRPADMSSRGARRRRRPARARELRIG
jgi:sulfate-transporting ATPase